MKAVFVAAFLAAASLGARAQDPFSMAANLLRPQHASANADTSAMTLNAVESVALQSNPEVRAASRRLALTQAHVGASGTLDDPTFTYRAWQVPLRQPWNYNAA